jgi:hypothetical protein
MSSRDWWEPPAERMGNWDGEESPTENMGSRHCQERTSAGVMCRRDWKRKYYDEQFGSRD